MVKETAIIKPQTAETDLKGAGASFFFQREQIIIERLMRSKSAKNKRQLIDELIRLERAFPATGGYETPESNMR